MSSSRNPIISIVAALAAWVSLLPLGPLIDGNAHLFEAALVISVVGVVGALGALLRVGRGITFVLQLVVAAGLVAWRAMALGTGSLTALVAEASQAIATQVPPVESVNGLIWVVLLLAVLAHLITELLTNVLEQPMWAFAPISLGFIIGGIAHREELEPLLFAAVAGAFVLLLLVSSGIGEGHRVSRASRSGIFHAARLGIAAILAVVAIVAAVAIQPLIPTGEKRPWEDTSGGPIQLGDPTVALNENLRRPGDRPMFTYRTSSGQPTYFRTVALPDITTDGVRLVPMQLRTSGLEGAYDAPGEELHTEVQMEQVPSEYLPAPFAVDSFDAEGDWSYDPETLAIVATGDDRMSQTVGLSYAVTSTVPKPDATVLDNAMAGDPGDGITSVVPDLDDEVAALTSEVVAGAETDGQKAQAIQSFLRSEEFEYSLDAPQHPGLDVISSFLTESRSGYCIHFAAGMATMARIEGIPARMAVGFNSGTQLEDGSFQVTSHNMHAWPELYFEGLGWVPFEPTPSVAQPPDYTDPDDATTPPSPEPSESPSPTPSTPSPSPEVPELPELPTPEPEDPGETDGGAGWAPWVSLAVLGLVALLAAPVAIRTGQERWRLRSSQEPAHLAAGAWQELESTWVDAGREWPGGSPGPAGRAAAAQFDDPSPLLEASEIVERTLYSRDDSAAERLPELVRAAKRQAFEGTSWDRRLLPRSLWRR